MLRQTAHPHEEAAEFAFAALLADADVHVSWVTAQLVLERARFHRPVIKANGERDIRLGEQAAKSALDRALEQLEAPETKPFDPLPPAWVKRSSVPEGEDDDEADVRWTEPDPLFDPRRAEKHLQNFPIEKWCAADDKLPFVAALIRNLVEWTVMRMRPPGRQRKGRNRVTDLIGWNDALGDMLARAAPFVYPILFKAEFLGPFLENHDDNELDVVAAFVDRMVTRQILDAAEIPTGTFELLELCIDHVINDSTFEPGGHRAGEIFGHDMPKLIEALLFVNVEKANGAVRFVNGDWSEIALIMPSITRLVSATGWSSFVMSRFLLLCTRAGDAYPLDHFITQAGKALAELENAKGNWAGTNLPARTAAVVQRLKDANFPLRLDQAQGLLQILDALIDLGDRRSAALELTEAFKGVQVSSSQ